MYYDEPLLSSIASSSRLNIAFSLKDLAGTAWAFAALAFHHAPLFQAISAPAMRMHGAEPRDLARFAWSLATLGVKA